MPRAAITKAVLKSLRSRKTAVTTMQIPARFSQKSFTIDTTRLPDVSRDRKFQRPWSITNLIVACLDAQLGGNGSLAWLCPFVSVECCFQSCLAFVDGERLFSERKLRIERFRIREKANRTARGNFDGLRGNFHYRLRCDSRG